ncbi:glycosyltransferase family 2 protein [Mobilicoccus pelagius]|uniref:Putative glycosyltransferase n=1 Tax=Mobilicoccus pelagius NBRC 104925 TaxID=1089455 RepID=H5UMQ7_9MICO|nr:glycosyltransferase [Mobilicoccus pelagius]GAB47015.1 putative glycosyltransferase [Mobilicoccus pelagius NBRC 104925]
MPHGPRVSVVIPCYQSERTVGEAISSALMQTYPDVEVVVCLDGATDRSGAIVDAYGDLLTVVRQENRGLAEARNSAVAAASGELIALLDADDVLLPPHVERAVARWQARETEKAYVTCNAYTMGVSGIVPRRTVLPRTTPRSQGHRLALLQRNIVSVLSVYPRAMHEEIGGFDPEMRVLEDYDFWVRAAFAGWTTLYETTPTALYRRTGSSLSARTARMAEYEQRLRRAVRERYDDRLTDDERAYLDRVLDMETQDVYLQRADAALREGRRTEAAADYSAAASLVPWDRRLRLKAGMLRHVPPTGALYRWRERVRREETSRA